MSAVITRPASERSSTAGSRLRKVWGSTVGLKLIMAATGVLLSGFVLAHMAGNLQAFQGAESLDAYGALLHREPAILWAARASLLVAVGLHIWAYVLLTRKNQKARGQAVREPKRRESTLASRSMRLTGPLLLVFIVYHILHLTTGSVHPDYHEGSVYNNLVSGLKVVPVAVIYLLAMGMLALHLWHGVWSMTQTLGLDQARYGSPARKVATVFTVVVCLGFAAIPLAVLAGFLK
jgi:succinate dehydrogenase / fumarate reductase, cytochrome b subunit